MRTFLTPVFALLTLLSPLAVVSAQDTSTAAAPLSIAFVQTSKVLAAHPAGKAAEALTQQARTELQQIATGLQPLIDKRNSGQQLTPEEQNTLELSQRTYQETQQRYQQEIRDAAKPAEAEINDIITKIAEANGYTLVLNRELAATSSLVVYGASSIPDITEEAVKEIQAAHPDAGTGSN